MSKLLRARLEGVVRMLSMEEFMGKGYTRGHLLALNNRACAGSYALTGDDITHVGNGSAVIMSLESQVGVACKILTELLSDGALGRQDETVDDATGERSSTEGTG